MKKLVFVFGLLLVAACGGAQEGKDGSAQETNGNLVGQRTGEPKNGRSGEPGSGVREPSYRLDDTLRMNQIQFKGSHNSYHLTPANPGPEQQYDMPPLTEQLAKHGVRALELDLHFYEGEFYVYHLPVDDDRSTCPRLVDCLTEIRAWSEDNPGHHVLVVYFDFRDEWDSEKLVDHLDELDAVLAANWPREKRLIPDDIVGSSADLESAVRARGWPTLGAARGKIMFVMWSFGDIPWHYAREGASLAGRQMFVAATYQGWPHGMILGMDTAHEQEAQIKDAVAKGYFVRTRSDDLPGRGGDFQARREAAFRSGAQVILTDYPAAGSLAGYTMNMPGGAPSRCNPISAPDSCYALAVENPALLK